MATKFIISYDGTNNENDALALGRLFAEAGAEVALAYVRHNQEPEPDREKLVQEQAESLLERGVEILGSDGAESYVVEDRSTPAGLRALAERLGASGVVFCSDSHTAAGRVSIGNSARRLLEGGPIAVAIAPAGLDADGSLSVSNVAAVGDGADASATATAESLASAIGANVVQTGNGEVQLLVVGSRPEAKEGTVDLTAASENLVEEARCPVMVVPHGVTLEFH